MITHDFIASVTNLAARPRERTTRIGMICAMAAPCTGLRMRGLVAGVERVGGDGARIDIQIAAQVPRVRPSQFFMLRRSDGAGPLLARPFSLYLRKPDAGGSTFSFLLKAMGPGTRALAAMSAGDSVEVVGPLGNGFPILKKGEKLVCVAGGVGIATFPLVFEEAIANGCAPSDLTLCFGAARKEFLYECERYRTYQINVRTATDDGSEGVRGNALDLLKAECNNSAARPGELSRPDKVFACGPERMLEAVAKYCLKQSVDCYLSLETKMGCGTGVCNVCAVPVRAKSNDGWPVAKACREGPVFNVRNLVFTEAHQY
ncbi:MAG: dihydroorotate dehydrogenase electron transfer subunit [Planctomycetota bacterium]